MIDFLARHRLVILAVLTVGLVAGAILSRRSASEPPPGSDPSRPIGRLGPTPGPDAEGYIADKRAYLERNARSQPSREAAALVSLDRKHRASEVSELALQARVELVFLVLPGADPEVRSVEGTVGATVASRVEEIRRSRRAVLDALEERAETASGPEREELEREASEARAELEELDAGCTCIYAFVIAEVTLRRLEELQGDPEVRLVDVPDPLTDDLRGWELTPLLPRDRALDDSVGRRQ